MTKEATVTVKRKANLRFGHHSPRQPNFWFFFFKNDNERISRYLTHWPPSCCYDHRIVGSILLLSFAKLERPLCSTISQDLAHIMVWSGLVWSGQVRSGLIEQLGILAILHSDTGFVRVKDKYSHCQICASSMHTYCTYTWASGLDTYSTSWLLALVLVLGLGLNYLEWLGWAGLG